jgi:hypothetical protein
MTTVLERYPQTHEHEPLERPTIFKFDLGSLAGIYDNPTIYNPSTFIDGTNKILVRVEERDNETSSMSCLFQCKGDLLTLVENAPRFKDMQDPYYLGTFPDPDDPDADPYHVIGGVKITVNEKTGKVTDWQDQQFRYKHDLSEIMDADNQPVPFLYGPNKSKDLRYVQLIDCIAVFPRPQDDFGGKGRIGFFLTKNLSTLQADLDKYFKEADLSTLIDGIFNEKEWGGSNQLIPLSDGSICIIGHKAHKEKIDDKNDLLYYRPFWCVLDPATGELLQPVTELDISPDKFDHVDPKQSKHDNVTFTGGLNFKGNIENEKFVDATVGLKDAAAGIIPIPNPIYEYMKNKSK